MELSFELSAFNPFSSAAKSSFFPSFSLWNKTRLPNDCSVRNMTSFFFDGRHAEQTRAPRGINGVANYLLWKPNKMIGPSSSKWIEKDRIPWSSLIFLCYKIVRMHAVSRSPFYR